MSTIPKLNLRGSDEHTQALNRWADSVTTAFADQLSKVHATNQQAHTANAAASAASTSVTNLGNTPVVAPDPVTGNMQQGSLNKLPVAPRPVSPITQDHLVDGTSRFARTSVHSSYRPLSNPLTAVDAGSNATINIAAHIMQAGPIATNNNSGTITGLSYATRYFIYYDDPTLSGGAVTYNATTTKEDTLQDVGRFFLGSIRTPQATAPTTTGEGDGGVGGQFGQTAHLLFGLITLGGTAIITNPNYAIDSDYTSFATISASGTQGGALGISNSLPQSRIWNFMQLQVLSSVAAVGSGSASITYSYSGSGSIGGTIYSTSSNRALTLDLVTLPSIINPALLSISASVLHPTSGTNTLTFYDARIIAIM